MSSNETNWSCHYCCCQIPGNFINLKCCHKCGVNFCDFVHCYDYFDGVGEYNRSSCRNDVDRYPYCINYYDRTNFIDRTIYFIFGVFWVWPVMFINCFNLYCTKNMDKCCLCIQEECCYDGECCLSKKEHEQNSMEAQDFARDLEVIESALRRVVEEDTNSYADHPPPEDGIIPPPYPETKIIVL